MKNKHRIILAMIEAVAISACPVETIVEAPVPVKEQEDYSSLGTFSKQGYWILANNVKTQIDTAKFSWVPVDGVSYPTLEDIEKAVESGSEENTETNAFLDKYVEVSTIILPEGLTEIPTFLFTYSDSPEYIKLPSTITTVGWGAFWFCEGIKYINFPPALTYIDLMAFEGTSNLEYIVLNTDDVEIPRLDTYWLHEEMERQGYTKTEELRKAYAEYGKGVYRYIDKGAMRIWVYGTIENGVFIEGN